MLDYFPLTTARGKAFCNRKEEIARLIKNIEMTRPTLIMSPRRYGKTSLALRTFVLSKIIYSRIDFYKELSAKDIEKSILNGIGQLLGQIESRPKQLLRLAGDFFANMRVSMTLNQLQLSVEVSDIEKRPADNIQAALEQLHALVKKMQLHVVFFIDEFQKIAEIADDYSIEAAIRSVAQISQNITFIFSGSNRHLIKSMFYDSSRPFYKMCDTMQLGRIEKQHYLSYIQNAAVVNWRKKISDAVIELILYLTENHPYYVNLLCSKLWAGKLPGENDVRRCWELCAEENRPQAEREIDLLSFNQRRLMISIARFGAVDKPSSQKFLQRIGISSTSTLQAISVLVAKDYIYKNQQGFYCILDPLLKKILS